MRARLARPRSGQNRSGAADRGLFSLSPVAGIVARRKGHRAEVVTYNSSDEIDGALLIAGCDPR